MSEQDMNQFMDEIDKSMQRLNKGDVVKGTVISITAEEAVVNIGHMADGIVLRNELSSDNLPVAEVVNVGDEIDLFVMRMDDGDGNVQLSKKRADQIVVWDELETSMNDSKTLNIVVKEAVKGGVTAMVKGVRAFIPASHLSVSYVENLEDHVGEKLTVKVIELDREKRKVVLSRKEVEKVEQAKMQEQLWDTLRAGEVRNGVVRRLEKFGAFIDIGGLDGLAHISALSWKRVKHPSEVVSIGDEVEVEILSIDREKNRVSLKVHNVSENPWNDIYAHHNVNDVVKGKVVRLTDFGAFVELTSGIEGLVHVSEISENRINRAADVLEQNQEVEVKILGIQPEDQRLKLSIKAVNAEDETVEDIEEYIDQGDVSASLGDLFGDKLKDLMGE